MKKHIFLSVTLVALLCFLIFSFNKDTGNTITELNSGKTQILDGDSPAIPGGSFLDLRTDWRQYVPDMYNWSETLPPIKSKKALDILAQITNLLISKNDKIEELDRLTRKLLSDSTISRHDKIGVLLLSIQNFGVDTEIGKYLLDTLASLHPFEITKEILDLFDVAKNTDTKKRIIILVTTLFALDTNQIEGNIPRIEYLKKRQGIIQDFLKKQFTEVNDKDILETLLRYYPLALNEDQSLVEYAEKALKRNQELFTPEVFTELYFGLISGQPGRQKEFDGLLEMARSEKSIARVVNNQLYLGLSGPDAKMVLSTQSKEWKEAVKAYIASQKPSRSDFSDVNMFAFEFGRWTQAQMELSEETQSNKLSSTLREISPLEQAMVMAHLLNTRQMSPEYAAIFNKYIANINTNMFALAPDERGFVEATLLQFRSFGQ
jgi:uncharacterized protein YjiS (DUF1127 family)